MFKNTEGSLFQIYFLLYEIWCLKLTTTHIYHLETLDFNLGTKHTHNSHLSSLQNITSTRLMRFFVKMIDVRGWVGLIP